MSELATIALLSDMLVRATPLIFAGLAVAVAFQAGILNIGAEGQLLIGTVPDFLSGTWTASGADTHLSTDLDDRSVCPASCDTRGHEIACRIYSGRRGRPDCMVDDPQYSCGVQTKAHRRKSTSSPDSRDDRCRANRAECFPDQ